PGRVYAPASTPATILSRIRSCGGDLVLVEGHIGDCGAAARAFAVETGAVDVSTLREPYRIEGKKTLGLELAEQLGWTLPEAIVYPTGGGTGLIGMWKAFNELIAAGWVRGTLPRLYTVQAAGCAPVVQAFETGAAACEPWPAPQTVAAGLRVPGPLGDRLMLRALRESAGGAVAVTDAELVPAARELPWLEALPRRLGGGLEEVGVTIREVTRSGVACTQVEFAIPEQPHGRHVGELVRLVERAPLSDWVKQRAVRAFRLIGEAEGRVHGVAPEQVHLHEVGAVDAVLDIVGGIEGFEQLGVEGIYNWPVAVGTGWVEAAHGWLPVPAPA